MFIKHKPDFTITIVKILSEAHKSNLEVLYIKGLLLFYQLSQVSFYSIEAKISGSTVYSSYKTHIRPGELDSYKWLILTSGIF